MKRKEIKFYRVMSLVLCMFFLAALSIGCSGSKKEQAATGSTASTAGTASAGEQQASAAETGDYTVLLDKVIDSSELPAWTGKTLKIKVWRADGSGVTLTQFTPENDVVDPEIQRITGVVQDLEGSFNNNGTDYNTKLGLVVASNDWPQLIVNPLYINKLADNGVIYDLTDLIPKYCPHIMAKIPKEGVYGNVWKVSNMTAGYTGKFYAVPFGAAIEDLPLLDKTIDKDRFARIYPPQDTNLFFNLEVREDLLTKLYPDVLTQNQIDDLYVQYGQFTEDQLFDVPIKSKDDFIKLLYNLKALIDKENIKEGEQKVEVTYARQGADLWALLDGLNTRLNGSGVLNNYVTYFDKTTKRVEFAAKQQWFKDDIKLYNKLVRDGIMSKESLVDSAEITQSKVDNGLYALTYSPWSSPNDALIQKTKPYRYRRLNTDIPFNSERYDFLWGAPGANYIVIPKSAVKQEDLPQLLKWIDFLVSDTGEKLVYWGPKTANLWEEVNGKRVFTNKNLENNVIYNVDNGEGRKYGLAGYALFALDPFNSNKISMRFLPKAYSGYDKNSPIYQYDNIRRSRGDSKIHFNPAYLGGNYNYLKSATFLTDISPDFWNFANNVTVAGTKFNNGGWTVYNEDLLKCLAAKDDAEFEEKYRQVLDNAAQFGLDDAGIAEMDAYFKKMNPDYIESLK